MLGVSTLFTFETVAIELVPGHLGLNEVGVHLALWALATIVAAAAYVRARDTGDIAAAPGAA